MGPVDHLGVDLPETDCSSVESENRRLTIGKVAESVDAWDCARDGTKHQISSQAVECVSRFSLPCGRGIYVSPCGVNCGLAPTWHPDSHLDRVEVVGKLTGGVTVGALGSDAA